MSIMPINLSGVHGKINDPDTTILGDRFSGWLICLMEQLYCWFKTGSAGRGLTTFRTPLAVACYHIGVNWEAWEVTRRKSSGQWDLTLKILTSKKELKFRRSRKRLRKGARWLPASRVLRNMVYNELDFLLNSWKRLSHSVNHREMEVKDSKDWWWW